MSIDDRTWIEPPLEAPESPRTLETVHVDFAQYQEMKECLDVRSWMSDQIHENTRFLLGEIDRLTKENIEQKDRLDKPCKGCGL